MTTADSPHAHEDDANPSRAQKAIDHATEEAKDVAAAGLNKTSDEKIDAIQERWENRLAWPVLIAAFLSVPAVFLTLLDEPFKTIGDIGIYLTTAVLVFETVIFFLISPEKIAWVRRNWWLIEIGRASCRERVESA